MDIIPIQGSAVPCERVFSSAKETMTPRRNRIKPELMEALQVLKFSVKKGRGLDFTSGLNIKAQEAALERFFRAEEDISEDIHSFVERFLQKRK